MSEQFLNHPQIRATVQDVGGRRMPYRVRSGVRQVGDPCERRVDGCASLPLPDAPSARSQEERSAARLIGQAGAAPANPIRQGGSSVGTQTKRASGPNVGSSGLGPKVPACSGPAMNSQNGVKSPACPRAGSKWCAAA